MNILKNKAFKILVFTYILSIVLGVISHFIIDTSIIRENINNYFQSYANNFNYINGFINTIKYNLGYTFLIWISGIIILGVIISPIILILKGISLGITIISIIITFKLKGILIAIILFLTNIIFYDLVYLLLTYYSINITNRTFKIVKNNQSINIKSYYKNYTLRYIILSIYLVLTSILDIYIISNLIKYIII